MFFSTLAKATLVNKDTTSPNNELKVLFNPESYQIARTVDWEAKKIPGQDVPVQQFISGDAGTLDLELFFDTSTSGKDVYDAHISDLEKLTKIQTPKDRPPLLSFEWGSITFQGVISTLSVDYQRFTSDGTPTRAVVNMTMREAAGAVSKEKESPDHTKLHTVRIGETIDQIAMREYEDPVHWKMIAEANDLPDPSRLIPGQRLTLPRLF